MCRPVVVTAYFRPAVGQHDRVWRRVSRRLPQCTKSGVVSFRPSTRSGRHIVMLEKWTSVRDLDDHGAGEVVG
jgi:quinol monooxygenase YgiN